MHNKIPMGHEFILPLTPAEHHLIDKGAYGLDLLQTAYIFHNGDPGDFDIMRLHDFEKFLFEDLCEKVIPPFGAEVMEAILQWHR